MSGWTDGIEQALDGKDGRGRGKRWNRRVRAAVRKGSALLVALWLAATPVTTQAASLPVGGEIRYGEGSIGSPVDGALTITQASERMVIDWLGFSIGKENAVYFDQAAGANAVALNRVVGGELSEIYGLLKADGQVFLINPQGVVFGEGAQVDVGGLVASSLWLSDEDFLAGNYRFGRASDGGGSVTAGPVVNQGKLTATPGEGGDGGYIVLLAPEVRNEGTISAQLGTVALGAGGAATVEVLGGGLLSFSVDKDVVGAYLANRGEIAADGGVVWLEARAKDALLSGVLNQEGIVRARGVESRGGRIVLFGGDSGVVEVRGTLDASGVGSVSVESLPDGGGFEGAQLAGRGGTGGAIDVTGERVALLDAALLDARGATGGGRVRIGGGYQGQDGEIANAQSVYVARGARIDASAVGHGEGGTVIVWSDGLTRFDGEIAARGGASGGGGGFVETSGGVLSVSGVVDVTAPAGASGTWLLDPYDITIGDGPADSGVQYDPSGHVWTSTGDNARVRVSSLLPALEAGSVVTVKTGDDGTGSGNIRVLAPVSWSGTGTLVLEAHHDIDIQAAITARQGGLTVSPGGTATASAAIDVGRFTLARGTWEQVGASVPAFRAGDFRLGASATFVRARGGDGGSKPYEILDVYGLQGVGSEGMLSKRYVLVEDIDASVTRGWNDGAGFVPIGTDAVRFTGAFDGAGHVIRGLFINRGDEDNVGPFGVIGAGGQVANVGLENVEITGQEWVGGLAGHNEGQITGSYVTGHVTGTGTVFGVVGGLVGRNDGSVSQSYSTGRVTGVYLVGGLVGHNLGGYVLRSYSTGQVTGSWGVGGLVGENDGSVSESYSTGRVIGGNFAGGLIGWQAGAVTASVWDKQTSGQNDGVGYGNGSQIFGLSTDEMMQSSSFDRDWGNDNDYWNFDTVWFLIEGETRPFLRSEWSTTIRNAHQLQLMAMKPEESYTLARDIDLTEVFDPSDWNASGMWSPRGFVPIGTSDSRFGGSFDGAGHVIHGLYINRGNENSVGLFSSMSTSGRVANVGLENVEIIGKERVGGLVGYNLGEITGSYVTGNVTGTEHVGGLVGQNADLAAVYFSSVSKSYFTGQVTGTNYVGGLVGLNAYGGKVLQSYFTGQVTATGDAVGGLVGENNGSVSQSHSTGRVIGNLAVGGLMGFNYGSVSESYSTGQVTGTSLVGGLVGVNGGFVLQSYSTGQVTGTMWVGGLVGRNNGSVSQSYAMGHVTGTGEGVGGLVGLNRGSVSESYSAGRVSGTADAMGGLIGTQNGSVTASFWDRETSGQNDGVGDGDALGVEGVDTGRMLQEDTFKSKGWDFSPTGPWRIISGVSYPYLSWQFGGEKPTVIWGKVDGAGEPGGLGVSAAIDGNIVGSTYTGANGFYYFALDPQAGKAVLTWLDGRRADGSANGLSGGSVAGLTLGEAGDTSAHATGLDIHSGILTVYAGDLTSWTHAVTTLLVPAAGELTLEHDGVPYAVDRQGITLQPKLGLSVEAGGDFTIDGELKAEGSIRVRSGGSLTLADGGRVESGAPGDAIVLVAEGVFVNENDEEDALSAPNGRWLIFSETPEGGDRGGLAHRFRYYGVDFEDDWWNLLPAEGNGFVYRVAPQVTVTLQGRVEKVYDGTDRAELTGENFAVTGALSGEWVVLVGVPTGSYDDRHAGTGKRVTIDLSGVTLKVTSDEGDVEIFGYSLANARAEGDIGVITPRPLIITGVQVADKVYDGTEGAWFIDLGGVKLADQLSELGGDLERLLGEDGVSLDAQGAWARFVGDGNAGDDKPVEVGGFVLAGEAEAVRNYQLVLPAGLTATITPAPLVVKVLDAQRPFGQENPVFVIGYEGFAPGEGPEVLRGSLTVVTEADVYSQPGEYPLILVGDVTAANYTITLVPGVLTVQPVALIQWIPEHLREAYLSSLVAYGSDLCIEAGDVAGAECLDASEGDPFANEDDSQGDAAENRGTLPQGGRVD